MAESVRQQTRSFRRDRTTPDDMRQVAIQGYRIDRLLGYGPLTAVYAALLESHQQPVALKVLLPHLASTETFVQRFLQAASSARMVTDERVLPCYDVGQSNGWVYLACELAECPSLAALQADGPMDQARAVYFAWQAALGLETIHQAGLVHGNIRPSNILIDVEDAVRLADLGLPGVPEAGDAHGQLGPAALHLAPECLQDGAAPDELTDIYALGVVLLGLLAGRTPAGGLSRGQLVERFQAGAPILDQIPGELVSGALAGIAARATALRREDRYQHIWHLREDLERLQFGFSPIHAREVGATSTAQQAVVAPTTRSRRPRYWLWGGVAAAILAGVGIWLAPRPHPSPALPSLPPVPAPAHQAPAPVAAPAPAEPRPSWASAGGSDAIGRWADLSIGSTSLRLRRVAPGSFWMGSGPDEAGRSPDEERHLVTLTHAYWLGQTEVTQAFWNAMEGSCPAQFPGPDRPVESVDWNTVQDFLAHLGTRAHVAVRLPSEAEWEYACRAGEDAAQAAQRAWTAADALDGTKAVATRPANAWGFHDMLGNVAEWCEDSYGRYRREPATDPLSTGGIHRVTRGGAWNQALEAARPASRERAMPVVRYFSLGFRIAISDTP